MGNTERGRGRRHSRPVHPHVRGEYVGILRQLQPQGGSSPRAWGIPHAVLASDGLIRFIPTCVGNTDCGARWSLQNAVHPHVRGEYSTTGARLYSCGGSSPRAWGIHPSAPATLVTLRFIPTCVGNTVLLHETAGCVAVHPHVRGEYPSLGDVLVELVGSSPRAWGIPRISVIKETNRRFIPTCVGNTLCKRGDLGGMSVHPHVRGEYSAVNTVRMTASGSSPRAWGILFSCSKTRSKLRFIPTCVGNTAGEQPQEYDVAVHPHVRGEYAIQENLQCLPVRFIPTCVGNTRSRRSNRKS